MIATAGISIVKLSTVHVHQFGLYWVCGVRSHRREGAFEWAGICSQPCQLPEEAISEPQMFLCCPIPCSLSLHTQVAASSPISKAGFGQGWEVSSCSPARGFPSRQEGV